MAKTRISDAAMLREVLAQIVDQGPDVVWQIAVYEAAGLADLIEQAKAGNPKAGNVLHLFRGLASEIGQAPADDPVLCLLCDHRFDADTRWPSALVAMEADITTAHEQLVQGICPSCFETHTKAGLERAIRAAYQHWLGWDTQSAHVHAAGHA